MSQARSALSFSSRRLARHELTPASRECIAQISFRKRISPVFCSPPGSPRPLGSRSGPRDDDACPHLTGAKSSRRPLLAPRPEGDGEAGDGDADQEQHSEACKFRNTVLIEMNWSGTGSSSGKPVASVIVNPICDGAQNCLRFGGSEFILKNALASALGASKVLARIKSIAKPVLFLAPHALRFKQARGAFDFVRKQHVTRRRQAVRRSRFTRCRPKPSR